MAVFSATFSTTGGGHVFCPVSRGGHVPGLRHVSGCDHSVTEAVSTLCHGYQDCAFTASPGTLGGDNNIIVGRFCLLVCLYILSYLFMRQISLTSAVYHVVTMHSGVEA